MFLITDAKLSFLHKTFASNIQKCYENERF